ncbi:tape measure protein [Burkholderia phage Mica]|uniref:Tape measure protein n=1 Tax=Burkholderia phage Mica TaxID=2767579 RepID=A0A873WBK0_9CAUD|nr:tape measure protein [Burkholderia phage Mica]QPB08637.1 tape measure protein [Burkholderia phage Mica]
MASNKKLSATITIGGAISGTLRTAFGDVNKSLGKIGQTVTDLTKRQKLLGRSIQEFGRAGKDVDGLRNRYAQLTQQLDRARRARERLTKAQAFKTKAGEIGGTLKGAAHRAVAGGIVMGGVLYTGIHASIERENAVNVIRNSGVSKEDAAAMVKAAQDSKQFGVSITRATETVSELRTALGDAHHAIEALPNTLKALSGLQLYNRGHKNQISEDAAYSLAKIAEERGGASSPEALREKQNWAFKALTGSNGVVTADDMLTAIRRGKSAVAAMNDRAFFGDTFLMQAMGANGYGTASSTLVNAWIGGHQTHGAFDEMMKLGLLNRGGVQFDKTGKVKKVSSSALIDNALFLSDPQAWVDKHLAPIAKSRGVDLEDPAQIAKFVNSIASNTNAANILMQRLRFSHNIAKDRHNVDIANGVDESDAANRASTQGKIDNARARLNDAQVRVGNVLLPAFATAMEKTASALEAVNKFADENPRLFKAVAVGLAGTAAALVVVAPVLLAANGILQTIALVRLASATAQVNSMVGALNGVGGAAASAGSGVLGFIGKLGMAAGLVGVALAAAKAAGLPDTDASKGVDDVKNGRWWAASAHLDAGSFLRAGAAKISGKSNEEIAASLAAGGNPSELKAPPMATARGAAPTVTSNDVYNFNITQQAGQDEKALADAIIRRMDQQKRVSNRSIMFDGASQ